MRVGPCCCLPEAFSLQLRKSDDEGAATALLAAVGVQGMAPTRLLRQAAAQAAARSAGAALLRDRDSGGAGTGGNSAVAPDVTSSPSPQQTVQAGASVLAEPPRVSPWADKLSEAELGGGWNLTWEVGDDRLMRLRPRGASCLAVHWQVLCRQPPLCQHCARHLDAHLSLIHI